MTPGRILFLLLATAFPLKAVAEEAPFPVSRYVDAALADNPSLDSMRERIRMKENAAIKAGALDDPQLRLGISNLPTRSWDFREEDMTGKEITLSQMFPWPGMLKTRTHMALREKEETEFVLEEMRSMLRSEIKMTYAELASVRRQIEAVRRSQDVLKEIVGVTQEIYAVGKGSQPDVLRGQVEFGRMREMRINLENREKVLSVRLNTLAALPADRPVPPLEDLPEISLPYGQADLVGIYEAERPARKALQARVRRGDSSIRMANLAGKPEFEVSLSYMQRDAMPDGTKRSDMVSSMVMMTLPIWRKEKIEPGIREMEAEKRMAGRELANLDLETSNSIGRSLATLKSRREAAVLYRTTLIPQAEQSFQVTAETYRVGKTDFPMLMDAAIAVLSFRREYAAMVGDLQMEKARLEAAVGQELEEVAPDHGGNAPPDTRNSNGEGR
ncbi:MAG TPA: TolC family protein [Candidatus Deferrimicrobium sp.]|nr:TolC family protein [Candidatus Deferrimicrobium sp.]